MRQFKIATWLLCCGCVMMYLVACTATQPEPTVSQSPKITQQLAPQQLPDGKHALAIFPWSIIGGFKGDELVAEPEGLRALKRAIRETDFIPTHSFYALEEMQLQRLTRKEFPKLRRVWRANAPNFDTIVHLGTELGVKAVFIYDMEVQFRTDVLRAYLIDMASQKVYQAEGETEDFAEESYDALFGLAQEVFTAYTHDQS